MQKRNLTLICEHCGKKAKYSIANVVISNKFFESLMDDVEEEDLKIENNLLLLEYFFCKSCYSRGPFQLTDKTIAKIMSEVLYIPFQETIEESFILVGEVRLEDGTHFQTVAMAEEYLINLIKEDPKNEPLYIRLGNLYKSVDLIDKSLEQFHKALEIDENNLETLFLLADIYVKDKQIKKGMSYYTRFLEKSPYEKSLDKIKHREFVEQAITKVLNIRLDPKNKIDDDSPLFPIPSTDQIKRKSNTKKFRFEEIDLSKEKDWKLLINLYLPLTKQYSNIEKTFRYQAMMDDLIYEDQFEPDPDEETIYAATKVHRNDPCPCGSGLKYKKCCGKINP